MRTYPERHFYAGTWSQDDVILFGGFPLLISGAWGRRCGQSHYLQAMVKPLHSFPSFLPRRTALHLSSGHEGIEEAQWGTFLSSLDAKPDEPPRRLLATAWEAQ